MNPVNSVLVEGNLCRDAEIKKSPSGTSICKLSIAVNRYFKSGDGFENEVSYFDVDTFGKTAEICAEKCQKGVGVRITGRLKQNRWTDSDGKSRSQVVIIGDHVEFRKKSQGSENAPTEDTDF